MKLVIKSSIGMINSDGIIISKDIDPEEILEKIDGVEIDGVRFDLKKSGNEVEIFIEDDRLSDLIIPNYSQKFVYEIKPKKGCAKFTAKVLNKFIRKFNKRFPDKIILIKNVKSIN